MLTDPEQAVRFARETGVDALAIAIGTSHGATKVQGTPHLDLDRLSGSPDASRSRDRAARCVVDGAKAIAVAERYGASCRTRGVRRSWIRRAIAARRRQRSTPTPTCVSRRSPGARVLVERPDLFNLYELMGEVEARSATRPRRASGSLAAAADVTRLTPAAPSATLRTE